MSPSNDDGTMSLLFSDDSGYSSPTNYDFEFQVSTSDGGSDDIILGPGSDESDVDASGGSLYFAPLP